MKKFIENTSHKFNINKDQILKKVEVFDKFLDNINKDFHTDKLSIDSLLEQLSPEIDSEMKSTAKNKNFNSLGGELLVSSSEDDSIQLNLKMYFSTIDNKIILKESTKYIRNDFLDDSAIEKIKTSVVPMKFEIAPPLGN